MEESFEQIGEDFDDHSPANSPCVHCQKAHLIQFHQALQELGITDAARRNALIDAGLQLSAIQGDDIPTTQARFHKLFVRPFTRGRLLAGRLGNLDTRVHTINAAADMERRGLTVLFEYRVDVGAGRKRFVDLVGIDHRNPARNEFVQFVKQNERGELFRRDEQAAADEIRDALRLQNGLPTLVNTRKKTSS